MNVIDKINAIMKHQNLTEYQLAKISGLSISTISNMRKRNTIPSVPTLENICSSLNMTMAQFFAEDDTQFYPVDATTKEFLDYYVQLTDEQRSLLLELAKNMKTEHK